MATLFENLNWRTAASGRDSDLTRINNFIATKTINSFILADEYIKIDYTDTRPVSAPSISVFDWQSSLDSGGNSQVQTDYENFLSGKIVLNEIWVDNGFWVILHE